MKCYFSLKYHQCSDQNILTNETMGAAHGKTKEEQKQDARIWAENKDNEIITLYGENAKLTNEIRLLQVDLQAMKQSMKQQQLVTENAFKENAAMCRRFEEKLEEQEQLITELMSKEKNAEVHHERKSPRRVHFEDDVKEEQRISCFPTTQEAHDAEIHRMFDDEWELILSSHAIVSAQKRYIPGGKLVRDDRLDENGLQAVRLLQDYGYPGLSIEEMRRQMFDVKNKLNKELFKFRGNAFRSVAQALFVLRLHATSARFF